MTMKKNESFVRYGTTQMKQSPPRWWQTLVMMMLLFAMPTAVMADNYYFQTHTEVKHAPTVTEP